ncbi:MAG TPA: universal stress protein [Solirubrobacteraceae bacterium]|nr:universal stress protein [Solirubrobacteraceae bacterium]
MFNNVLVGVDGRPSGRDAIALARQLAEPEGRLTFANVYGGSYRLAYAGAAGFVRAEREAAGTLLQQARTESGVDARLISVEAPAPGRGLHEQAEDQEADLLVLGSCSHRGVLGRVALGDDTRAAVDGASCAVAIAPHGYAQTAKPFASIGVGYDGSEESQAAVEVAKLLAQASAARVHAMRVVSLPTYLFMGVVPPVGPTIEEMTKEARDEMQELGVDEVSAHHGLAGEELAGLSSNVDLLIVGSRGYGPMRRLVLSSTSNYLQHHCRGPLLVLPRGTRYAHVEAEDGKTAMSSVSA